MSPIRTIALLVLVATFSTPSQSRSILQEAVIVQEDATAAVPDEQNLETEESRSFFEFGPFKKDHQCLLDKDCSPPVPYCLINTNKASLANSCVECTNDEVCPHGHICSLEGYECIPQMINGPTDPEDPKDPADENEDIEVGLVPPETNKLEPPSDLLVVTSDISPRRATIRWKAPSPTVTDYQVYCSSDGQVVGPQRFNGTTTGTDGFIGLSAGSLYTCQAESIGETGVSEPSVPSNEFSTACGTGTVISMQAAVVGAPLPMPETACALRTTSGLVSERASPPANSQPMCGTPTSLPPSDIFQSSESGQSVYYFTVACPSCCVKVELDTGDCGEGFSAYPTSPYGPLPLTGVWAYASSIDSQERHAKLKESVAVNAIGSVTSVFSFQAPQYESEWGLVINTDNSGYTCEHGPIKVTYA